MAGWGRARSGRVALLAALLLVGLPVASAAGEIFRYRDPAGVLHFSNAPTDGRFRKLKPGDSPADDSRADDSQVEPGSGASAAGSAAAKPAQGPRQAPLARMGAVREPPAALARIIDETAFRFRIEKALLHAIVRAESGFDPLARSRSGACGLMQLMPATAAELGVRDIFHPRQNLEAGALYYRRLLHRFGGDPVLALAAFNAGPGAVEAHRGVPPFAETQEYIRRIARFRREHLKAREDAPHMVERRAAPES
ncbi:MAG: lytic transglycosylase domain-containing protein [Deltaproteobacteria bacterium]